MRQGMKVESQNVFLFFFNLEFSFNKPSIITNFLQKHLKTIPERRVSQNSDLGSR